MALILSGTTGIDFPNAISVSEGGTGLESPGTAGNVLTSDGTGWVSSAPDAPEVTASSTNTLSNKTINFADNTINMTLARLNTAIFDADVASLTGAETLTNKTLTTPVITGGKETKVAMAANDIDLSAGSYFSKTISTATTFTVSSVPTAGTVASFVLDLTNGGSATITWWSGMKWASGTAPALTSSGRDLLGFFTHDGGTTWNGLVLAKDIK